jgi:hypothetical protein
VNCYFFIAVDFHHLLLAGLPAHPTLKPEEPFIAMMVIGMGGESPSV